MSKISGLTHVNTLKEKWLKFESLSFNEVSAGADGFFHMMVAVASGSESLVACGTLEGLQVEVDPEVTLEVAQLPHLFLANFTFEHIGVHTACLLADVVLTDAVAHYVAG